VNGGDAVAGGFSWYWFPTISGNQYPWALSPTPDATPTPTPSPTATPSGDPSGFIQSAPPVPPDQNGTGGFDVCDPQFVDAHGAQLCASNPAYSFAPATADPEGFDGVMLHLSSKAPFGYINQVVSAVEDAAGSAPGGSGPSGGTFGCFTLPRWAPASAGGTTNTEVCIPFMTFASAAAPFRPAILAMFLVLAGVAMLRWASRASGGGE
jgi:hypothetical protein